MVFWHRRNSCNLSQIWNVIHSSEPRYLETIADWNSDGSVTQDETDDKNFFCVSECYLGGVIIAHSSNLLLKRQLIRSVKFRSYNRVLINGVTLIRMKMCEWVGASVRVGACVLACQCVCLSAFMRKKEIGRGCKLWSELGNALGQLNSDSTSCLTVKKYNLVLSVTGSGWSLAERKDLGLIPALSKCVSILGCNVVGSYWTLICSSISRVDEEILATASEGRHGSKC